MRIGMRLLMGYFLIVAIAAWFVLSIFVQEIKPGVRRATEGIRLPCLPSWPARIYSPPIPSTGAWPRLFKRCIASRSTPTLPALIKFAMNITSI